MSPHQNDSHPEVNSPCRNVCTLNDKGMCIGCFRAIDEIANWNFYSDFQRNEIRKITELRMQLPGMFDGL